MSTICGSYSSAHLLIWRSFGFRGWRDNHRCTALSTKAGIRYTNRPAIAFGPLCPGSQKIFRWADEQMSKIHRWRSFGQTGSDLHAQLAMFDINDDNFSHGMPLFLYKNCEIRLAPLPTAYNKTSIGSHEISFWSLSQNNLHQRGDLLISLPFLRNSTPNLGSGHPLGCQKNCLLEWISLKRRGNS